MGATASGAPASKKAGLSLAAGRAKRRRRLGSRRTGRNDDGSAGRRRARDLLPSRTATGGCVSGARVGKAFPIHGRRRTGRRPVIRSAAPMMSEPQRRNFSCGGPPALPSASSERKRLQHTDSAGRSVRSASASGTGRISRTATGRPAPASRRSGLRPGWAAADNMDGSGMDGVGHERHFTIGRIGRIGRIDPLRGALPPATRRSTAARLGPGPRRA